MSTVWEIVALDDVAQQIGASLHMSSTVQNLVLEDDVQDDPVDSRSNDAYALNSVPAMHTESAVEKGDGRWHQESTGSSEEGPSDVNVVTLSARHVEPPSNITAAVCFKTLFGNIDLGLVIQWAAYNTLLGFDRIFMFYRPEVTLLPRWKELSNLPYVVLTEQTKGKRKDYYDQAGTETMCLTNKRFAASYDWVLTADIDEYLWFNEKIGVKEFLQRHRSATYLSVGKQMYSLSNRVDSSYLDYKLDSTDSSAFAVSSYPFNMKYFCRQRGRKSHPICPTWVGRAKVLVRPMHHGMIKVHGTLGHNQLDNKTAIHFHPDVVHFMEWPEIFARHNVSKREAKDFTIGHQDEVSIHDVHTGFTRIGGDGGKFLVWDGRWQVDYDAHLNRWFDFVVSRARIQGRIESLPV